LHAKGTQVLLASSSEKSEVDHYVGLLRVEPFLTGTVSKDDVENSKPAGDIFAAALAKVFPLSASETMAVGDTPYDAESALRSTGPVSGSVVTILIRLPVFGLIRLNEISPVTVVAL